MVPDDGSVFDLRRWLAAQDVTDHDETLNDGCARVHALHQSLVSEEHGLLLARRIADGDIVASVRGIVLLVDSEEPRLAVMVLVDLVGVLNMREEENHGRRVSMTMGAIVLAIPLLFRTLDKRARDGDVCEDTMSYAMTLLSFLLAEEFRLGQSERLKLRTAVTDTTWLKAVMRLWKENDILGHVPGVDVPDHECGLGAAVTTFLHHVVQGGKAEPRESWGVGARALVKLGSWVVSFISMRLYNEYIGDRERIRLMDVLYACCTCDPTLGSLLFNDAATMQAICHSASCVQGRRDCDLDLEDEDEELGLSEEQTALQVCEPVDAQQELADSNMADRFDPEILSQDICTLNGVYAHLRLLQYAVREGKGAEDRHRRFFRLCGCQAWLWEALACCSDNCAIFADYKGLFDDKCSDFLAGPCCISALSNFLWALLKWLGTDPEAWDAPRGDSILPRSCVLAQSSTIIEELCATTDNSLVPACTRALARTLMTRELEKVDEVPQVVVEESFGEAVAVEMFCEYCLRNSGEPAVSGSGARRRMKACSGCNSSQFCTAGHLRAHWKRCHKRACKGKLVESLASFGFQASEDGFLKLAVSEREARAVEMNGGSVVPACVRDLGQALVSLGGAVRLDELLKSESLHARYMPRGRLLASLKCSGAERDLLSSLATTCATRDGEMFFVANFADNSPENKALISLCRVQKPEKMCSRLGCCGHDAVCTIAISHQG